MNTYVLRIYYRGMQGEWNKDRTRTYKTREAGNEAIDRLVLGNGWKAQLVERLGRKDVEVLKTVQP